MKKIKYPGLVAEMARRGITQKDIGKIIGVPHGCISRRMNGEIEWSISEIETLCDYFQKDYYELFKNNNEQD